MGTNTPCIWCGHTRASHTLPLQVPSKPERLLGSVPKALSECPGYDSGDPDMDLQDERKSTAAEEQEYLDEMRPHPTTKSHWDT
jgi:hypothetical protein